jgi:hypothetical protein
MHAGQRSNHQLQNREMQVRRHVNSEREECKHDHAAKARTEEKLLVANSETSCTARYFPARAVPHVLVLGIAAEVLGYNREQSSCGRDRR